MLRKIKSSIFENKDFMYVYSDKIMNGKLSNQVPGTTVESIGLFSNWFTKL